MNLLRSRVLRRSTAATGGGRYFFNGLLTIALPRHVIGIRNVRILPKSGDKPVPHATGVIDITIQMLMEEAILDHRSS